MTSRAFGDLLHVVAVYRANILTIHQSIPVNGVATLTLSVEVREDTENVSSMIDELEVLDGIHYVKILAEINDMKLQFCMRWFEGESKLQACLRISTFSSKSA